MTYTIGKPKPMTGPIPESEDPIVEAMEIEAEANASVPWDQYADAYPAERSDLMLVDGPPVAVEVIEEWETLDNNLRDLMIKLDWLRTRIRETWEGKVREVLDADG